VQQSTLHVRQSQSSQEQQPQQVQQDQLQVQQRRETQPKKYFTAKDRLRNKYFKKKLRRRQVQKLKYESGKANGIEI
jgi:hypothetical protein